MHRLFQTVSLGTSVHTGNLLSRIANSTAVSSPCPVGYWSCIRTVFRTLSPWSPFQSPSGAHSTSTTSGFPFSTTYVASSAALAVPTFFTAWIVSAGTKKTSPALSVVGGLPST